MRGVGGEHAAHLEAPLETPEHLVQRLDEPADLVGRPRMRQAIGEVRFADLASAAPGAAISIVTPANPSTMPAAT